MQVNKTAIIILNYNNYEDTIICVESIKKFNTAPVKIIVVENGSTREGVVSSLDSFFLKTYGADYVSVNSEKPVREKLPYITLVCSETNDGYAKGNKKGLKFAYGDTEISHVMILNNDVLFVEDIIPSLLRYTCKISNCGIVSPLLYKKNLQGIDYNCARKADTPWAIFLKFLFYYVNPFGFKTKQINRQKILLSNPLFLENEFVEIELPSGSCMLLSKQLFQDIDDFDGHTFLYYEEDILQKKLEKRGLKNYLIPQLKCIHLGASSTKHSVAYFIIKASVDSADYYVSNYSKASYIFKKFFHFYLYKIFLPIVKIQKQIKGK